jgi:hypothetical protein
MAKSVRFKIKLPRSLANFGLPQGVHRRLRELLDKRDGGQPLSAKEMKEAEGLVDMADLLSLLRLRAGRTTRMTE